MGRGIVDLPIQETPIAVIDFETTGFSHRRNRVVEVAVVRVEPGSRRPKVVLETLINPCQRVKATRIHGITSDMVCDAPTFGDLWPSLRNALAGCVVAAYNAAFDLRFLRREAKRAGVDVSPPYLCLKNVRPLIGIGKPCSLEDACRKHRIARGNCHRAKDDALASAKLVPIYLEAMECRSIETFGHISGHGWHRYMDSFEYPPLKARKRFRKCDLLVREAAMRRVT